MGDCSDCSLLKSNACSFDFSVRCIKYTLGYSVASQKVSTAAEMQILIWEINCCVGVLAVGYSCVPEHCSTSICNAAVA